nr:MAG TPA: hypothetical protein [Caudoviricetes sp.]
MAKLFLCLERLENSLKIKPLADLLRELKRTKTTKSSLNS